MNLLCIPLCVGWLNLPGVAFDNRDKRWAPSHGLFLHLCPATVPNSSGLPVGGRSGQWTVFAQMLICTFAFQSWLWPSLLGFGLRLCYFKMGMRSYIFCHAMRTRKNLRVPLSCLEDKDRGDSQPQLAVMDAGHRPTRSLYTFCNFCQVTSDDIQFLCKKSHQNPRE